MERFIELVFYAEINLSTHITTREHAIHFSYLSLLPAQLGNSLIAKKSEHKNEV